MESQSSLKKSIKEGRLCVGTSSLVTCFVHEMHSSVAPSFKDVYRVTLTIDFEASAILCEVGWFARSTIAHAQDVTTSMSYGHRCQPSRNRVGNPAFWLISRIPAFLRGRPEFLALFRNNKNS